MYKNNSTSRGGRKPIVAGSVVALLLFGVITSVAYVRDQTMVEPEVGLLFSDRHIRSKRQIRNIGDKDVKKNAKALRDVADTLYAIDDALLMMKERLANIEDTLESNQMSHAELDGRITGLEGRVDASLTDISVLDTRVTGLDTRVTGLDSRVTGVVSCNSLVEANEDESCAVQVIEGFTFQSENTQGLPEYTHDETGIEFVLLPGGDFEMGSPPTEAGRGTNEGPVHTVTLSPFLIAKYEVTQAEYEAVMTGNTAGLGPTPSFNFGTAPLDTERPVERVSFNDLKDPDGFLARTGLSLPSEAQWEYACRAGQAGPYSGTGVLDDMGWFSGNDGGSHHPVGTKNANQFGLFDMHGNVYEWSEDVYNDGFYATAAAAGPDPVATSGSRRRVIRGGHFHVDASYCRSAFRFFNFPSFRIFFIGFRPARPLP
jgi:formylglycine-generating enzyme required for sulfatase activity